MLAMCEAPRANSISQPLKRRTSSDDRLRLAAITSIPRFSGKRLPRRLINAGWRVAARQSD
jgi:hypothetical protein